MYIENKTIRSEMCGGNSGGVYIGQNKDKSPVNTCTQRFFYQLFTILFCLINKISL